MVEMRWGFVADLTEKEMEVREKLIDSLSSEDAMLYSVAWGILEEDPLREDARGRQAKNLIRQKEFKFKLIFKSTVDEIMDR